MVDRSFEFMAGSLALNFIDTVADRQGRPRDLLRTPRDLQRWLFAAGLRPLSTERKVRGLAVLEQARALRDAIYRATHRAVAGQGAEPGDVECINEWAAQPGLRPQLIGDAITYTADDPVRAALSTIAADAVRCLDPETRSKLRQCPGCAMLFKDNSRPQQRIWCSSTSGCGNRAKVRRHRANKSRRTSKETSA